MINREKFLRRLFCVVGCLCFACIGASAECDHEFKTNILPAGCITPGIYEEFCIHCGMVGKFETIEPLGHSFSSWSETIKPDCKTPGIEQRKCTRCYFWEERATTPLGHEYLSGVVAPTCTKKGYTQHKCSRCGNSYRDTEVPATGHQYVTEVVAPTCTKKGYTQHKCSRCGDSYRDAETAAVGHHYDNGVLTKEPTTTAMGRITYTCIDCGDTYQITTPKLMNPFDDVKPKNYFYNSVLWAANMGITSGVDMTHFAPDQTCTRGQVMVFLWRAMGSPEPESSANPFSDVYGGDYFKKAVLWAYHAGVTAGVDETHFGPGDSCTRAQVVTFLHSVKGRPAHSEEDVFYDVDAASYYYDAVLWAAENSITTGVGYGMFAPNEHCNRGQIVTFLYQARNV